MGNELRQPVAASVLARALGLALDGDDTEVHRVDSVVRPARGSLVFSTAEPDWDALAAAAPLVVLVRSAAGRPPTVTVLVSDDPAEDFARVVTEHVARPAPTGIATTAVISPSARLSPGVSIGEHTVVGDDVEIGEGTVLLHHIVVAAGTRIGRHCLVKSGTVIGEPGFGVRTGRDGNLYHFPHVGSVVIGDHVEVGAKNTVCSGTIYPTTIGDHTKIDDHVHVGHNMTIGKNVVITAHVETGGSVTIEDEVWIGPNSTIIEGRTIGRRAMIGLMTSVRKDVEPETVVAGTPARFIRQRRPDE